MVKKVINYVINNKGHITKYGIISIIATGVDFAMFSILTKVFLVNYILSNIISYSIGLCTNYPLNRKYNFKSKNKKVAHQFSFFATISMLGLLLNTFLLFIFVSFVGLDELIAKLFAIFIVFFWNYVGHKHLVFKIFK
ncbi:GtrA family protein [Candidatus Woesearchaeota archaeon]|nr:GtrA family protein [Candidatus Woesearchaeota archaeon]